MSPGLKLKPQEPTFDHADTCNMFPPGAEKPFVATGGAVDKYQHEVIIACLCLLRAKADQHCGIDYLQDFENEETGDRLWFIEDGDGGATTALLPEEY